MKKSLKKDNIEGYPGYHISKDGIVYTRKKITEDGWVLGDKWRRKSIKFKPKTGYMLVKLSRGKERKTFRVHRLVAMAYIQNPDPERFNFVCHKDNDRTNNKVDNLYWGNHEVNMAQMVDDGNAYWTGRKRPEFSGDLHPMNKVKESTYWFMMEKYKEGLPFTKIAEAYSKKFGIKVSATNVRRHILQMKESNGDS